MPQCCNVAPPTPTTQMLKTAERINCQMPLNGVGQCQYKICHRIVPEIGKYEIDQTRHLEKTDKYWSEFLRAQRDSTANYLYKINVFGEGTDPTLVKKVPFPENLVRQRLLHMPYMGGLLKGDMFYILSFILNVKDLSLEKQTEYMEYLQNWKLLDLETLNYMQIMARHHNTGLNAKELEQFQSVCQHVIERTAPRDARNYFNPDFIFIKCMVEIDPYELAFLKFIMETEGQLEQHEFLYLVNFVERLQEMPIERRDEYLKLLKDKKILQSSRFEKLVDFMRSKAKKIDRQKLKLMLSELFKLLDIGPCFPEPEEMPTKKPSRFIINIDAMRIWKALNELMKPGIPNIVRVMDLKKFLQDLLLLQPLQLEDVFLNMKNVRILDAAGAKFIERFIVSGQLGNGDPEKKRLLLQILKQVMDRPSKPGVLVKVDIPAPKGPHKTETSVEKKTAAATPAPAVAEIGKTKAIIKEAENKEKAKDEEKDKRKKQVKKKQTKKKSRNKRK